MKTPTNHSFRFRHLPKTLALTAGLLGAADCTMQSAAPPATARRISLLGQDGELVVSDPNTIVNRYAALQADAASGSTTMTVEDVSGLLPLASGDLLLIIQMQGAAISTADAEDYGTVTDLGNAGKHELVKVASVDGNVITVDAGCGGLKNDFTASGRVQVVRVPQLSALSVASGASITAPPWNGKVGGIVAMHVDGEVTLDGDIDVSGRGFRGGAVDAESSPVADDVAGFVAGSGASGAEKGEGIAGGAADYDLLGGRFGRGAPATGGGGGNSYNAGGGGGANAAGSFMAWNGAGVMNKALGAMAWSLDPDYVAAGTYAASAGGGRGGYSYSALAADPQADAPGMPAWGGNQRRERGGRGGHPQSGSAKGRLFLGGGGGAGDADELAGGAGGSGGGIVHLTAYSVRGSGRILASGQDGGSASGMGIDAAGGGGAGGSVVVRAESLGGLTVLADGGSGGNQQSAGLESAGPGGGGGGGLIALAGGIIEAQASGGAAGSADSSSLTMFSGNGATLGAEGQPFESAIFAHGENPLCMPADIAVALVSQNGSAIPGNGVAYTIAVENRGAIRSRYTAVKSMLPDAIGSATWACRAEGGAVCPPDLAAGQLNASVDLPPGAIIYFDMGVQIPATQSGTLGFNISAAPALVVDESTPGDNQLVVTDLLAPLADVAVSLQAIPTTIRPGAEAALSLHVSNSGVSVARDVHASLRLPEGMRPTLMGALGWQCATIDNRLECARPELAVGEGSEILLKTTPPADAKAISAIAEVRSEATPDPVPGNNLSQLQVLVSEQDPPSSPPAAAPAVPEAPAMGCSMGSVHTTQQNGLWTVALGLLSFLGLRNNNRRRRA